MQNYPSGKLPPDNSHLNFLNDAKIIVKEMTTKLPNTKMAFSGLINP